jgi:hypothetical protein
LWHLTLNDSSVQVYEFSHTAAREVVSSSISPRGDGYTITEGENTITTIWDGESYSRWWARDNLLVGYSGLDTAVADLITSILGQPFADGSLPYRPEAGSGAIAGIGEHGVSFQYDPYLAANLAAEIIPIRLATGSGGFGFDVMPDHIAFTFLDTYADDWTIFHQTINVPHQPQILIFPLDAYASMNEMAQAQITALDSLLAARPELPSGALPHLPPPNGQQDLQAQLAYLTFQNGEGIRYLTQFNQEPRQINNQEIYYTFQGITADHSHYVAAFFPVQSDSLPADNSIADYDAFASNVQTYLAETTADLNALPTTAFTPDLALLDAIIQSLRAEPAYDTIRATDTPDPYIYAMQDVTIYSGPDEDYEMIGSIFAGQTALVTGAGYNNNWWRVICPDDTVGNCWVTGDTTFVVPVDSAEPQATLPDPSELEMEIIGNISPDSRWQAIVNRSEPVVILQSEKFYNSLTVSDGTTTWTPVSEWRDYGLGFLSVAVFQWSQDGRALYYTNTGSPDGCFLYSNGTDLYRLDLTDGSVAEILPPGKTSNLSFLADESLLAYITTNGQEELFVWRDMATGIEQSVTISNAGGYAQTGPIFWTADGTTAVLTLVYDYCLPGQTSSIVRINLDTLTATTLIEKDEHLFQIQEWDITNQSQLRLTSKDGQTWLLDVDSGDLTAE